MSHQLMYPFKNKIGASLSYSLIALRKQGPDFCSDFIVDFKAIILVQELETKNVEAPFVQRLECCHRHQAMGIEEVKEILLGPILSGQAFLDHRN